MSPVVALFCHKLKVSRGIKPVHDCAAVGTATSACDPKMYWLVELVATIPVPLKAAVCGEPEALSATESVAEKLVAEAGVKVT